MRQVPLELDINIAVNCPFWLEVANPEHPFTAMLISHSRGTCIILQTMVYCCKCACLGDDVAGPRDEGRVDVPSELLLRDEVLGGVVAGRLPPARSVAHDEALARGGPPEGGTSK